jgi:hypothetical protein
VVVVVVVIFHRQDFSTRFFHWAEGDSERQSSLQAGGGKATTRKLVVVAVIFHRQDFSSEQKATK